MKTAGILTINSMNLGNRLQNYALQTVLENMGCDVETILRGRPYSLVKKAKQRVRSKIIDDKYTRYYQFNQNIHWSKCIVSKDTVTDRLNDKYDLFVIGSDQVWNPTFSFNSELEFLPMIDVAKKIAYAASFGVSVVPAQYRQMVRNGLLTMEHISVREEAGVDIVKELTGKQAVVTLDPTLLLSQNDWRKAEKPIRSIDINQKYILKYFLGNSSDEMIRRIVGKTRCGVIDVADEKLPIGPAEFLYLIDHAEIILTDSFHASVFSFIFQKPFIVFDRNDETKDMTSRLDTLCDKFGLQNHRFRGALSEENLTSDYAGPCALLKSERDRSLHFLQSVMATIDA